MIICESLFRIMNHISCIGEKLSYSYRASERGKDKLYFDNVSLIDSDSFQVSCRFPDLFSVSFKFSILFFCFTSYFVFSIAVLQHNPRGV